MMEECNNQGQDSGPGEKQICEVSYSDKILTDEQKVKLESDTIISNFKQMKLEKEAQKNWDLFYKRNTTKFFKDRNWTRREFEELCCHDDDSKESKVFFEVGCGVGNFIFPLLEDDKTSFFYACDFSPRAVEFVKAHPAYNPERCKAFQCDITNDTITENVPAESVDVATLIFVLSAISPDKMVAAVKNVIKTLKPGGVLLVRDYGLYDHAMLRFAKGHHKLSECFYVRQDGTRAYYFSIDKLNSIMEESGLELGQCSYIHRATVNKKEGINVQRIFLQGRFIKPNSVSSSSSTHPESDTNTIPKACDKSVQDQDSLSSETPQNLHASQMSDDSCQEKSSPTETSKAEKSHCDLPGNS